MSATLPSRPQAPKARRPERTVAFDRFWLVLEMAPVLGMPVLTVVESFTDPSRAEHRAGWHESPVIAWLLWDGILGWRLRSGHGWVARPDRAGRFTEEEAEQIMQTEPSLELRVIRADGRCTHPDVVS